ncbi:MAG: T9SS type A sorting domain-containing protein [Chitinophagaceae bacterium]
MKKIFYILIFTVLYSWDSFSQSKTPLIITDLPVKFMRYYPNPAVSVINFEFQKGYDKAFTLQVFNFIGKKVLDLKTITPNINIPLTDFYRGVYIYQLRDRTGKIIDSGKFQVVK